MAPDPYERLLAVARRLATGAGGWKDLQMALVRCETGPERGVGCQPEDDWVYGLWHVEDDRSRGWTTDEQMRAAVRGVLAEHAPLAPDAAAGGAGETGG